MTSNNTNTYVYFISYESGTVTGTTACAFAEPISSWHTLCQTATQIGASLGYTTPVTITTFRLLSSPQQPLQIPVLYSEVNEAVKAANQQLARRVDSHDIAESLLHTLIQVRDVLAVNLPSNTTA